MSSFKYWLRRAYYRYLLPSQHEVVPSSKRQLKLIVKHLRYSTHSDRNWVGCLREGVVDVKGFGGRPVPIAHMGIEIGNFSTQLFATTESCCQDYGRSSRGIHVYLSLSSQVMLISYLSKSNKASTYIEIL